MSRPILSALIVKGKFAYRNIPKKLQRSIIAESGTNDGLGYPFLFIPLYLIRYTHDGGLGRWGGASKAIANWFGISWGYKIILSVLYRALVRYIYRVALRWAEDHKCRPGEFLSLRNNHCGIVLTSSLNEVTC